MSKATDKILGELHGRLAKAMLSALESSDSAIVLLEQFSEELPEPVAVFLEKQASYNPALLTAITKFLKDNSITCSIEDNEEISELEKRLKDKRRKSVGNVVTFDGA